MASASSSSAAAAGAREPREGEGGWRCELLHRSRARARGPPGPSRPPSSPPTEAVEARRARRQPRPPWDRRWARHGPPPRASAPIMAAAAELRAPCSTSWRSPSRSGCRRSGSGVGLADAMSTRSASTAASTKRAAVVEQQGRGAVGGLAQLPREGAVLGQHRGEPLLDGRRGWRRRRERVDDGRELELSSGAGCRPRHGRRCASPPRHGGALRAPPRGKEAAAAAGRIWPPRPAVSRARTGEPAPPRLALRLAAAGTRAGEPAPPRPAAGTRASSAACAGRRGG